MQSFILMGIITVLWALFGYSMAFGTGSSFLGGFDHIFLRGVGAAPDPDYAGTIPAQTFMVYQLMFAIITPCLIAGAFAERMKFSAVALWCWAAIIQPHGAHGLGKGGLLNAALGAGSHLDFAGGTVVHITSRFGSGLRALSAASVFPNADAS
jgi:Amt family ammonium transporter